MILLEEHIKIIQYYVQKNSLKNEHFILKLKYDCNVFLHFSISFYLVFLKGET